MCSFDSAINHTSTCKISIVVPTYNVEKYIHQCLDSLLNQTLDHIEIICSDDCSADSTISIIKSYAGADSRIKYILHNQNSSASKCRKDAVLASSGEYIIFVDGDDYLEPTACEKIYSAITSNNTDILQYGTVIENCANLSEDRIINNENVLKPYTKSILTDSLLENCFLRERFSVNLWNKAFNGLLARAAFSKAADHYIPKANDVYALFLLLDHCHSYSSINEPLYHYCFGRGMTGQNNMTLEQFRLHSKSIACYQYLCQYVADFHQQDELERYTVILNQIKVNFMREIVNRLTNNVAFPDKKNAVMQVFDEWGLLEGISLFSNRYYYNSHEFLPFVKDMDCFQYTPRTIRTIALYYRSINNGGAQRVVAMLSNILSSAYKVILITEELSTQTDYDLIPSVQRDYIPGRPQNDKAVYSERAKAWHQLIDKYQIDAVISSMWVDYVTPWDLLTVHAHSSHPAFLIHAHNFCAFPFSLGANTLCNLWESFSMSDAIVTLSKTDQYFWSLVNKNSISIANPCHFKADSKKRASYDGKSILWLARISNEKQPLHIISIMKRVCKDIPDAVCHVVGSGDENLIKDLSNEIIRNNLEKNIILEGFSDNVSEFYQNSSAFIMTSLYEGYALTLYEACAFGLSPILYNMDWLPFMDDIKGYRTVPQGDTERMGEELVKLLSDPSEWKKRSDESFNSFCTCTDDTRILQNWKALLDSISKSNNHMPDHAGYISVLMPQILYFHKIGLQKAVYEANNKLQQTYAEKSEINRKLQQTYAEKSERGQIIQKQKKEIQQLNNEIKSLKSSGFYKVSNTILRILRKLKRLIFKPQRRSGR